MTPIPAPDHWGANLPLGTVIPGENCFILNNRNYRADGTVPGFVYCGAYSAGAWNLTFAGFALELARRGYPVIAGDCGDTPSAVGRTDGPGCWGTDANQLKLDAYRAYLQGTMGARVGKIGLLYGSHGCALAYNWAKAHPNDAFCIAGAIGTCDLEDIRANNRGGGGGFQASIESRYGGNDAWQSARPTHNPVEFAATLNVPQLDYFASDDPICMASTHEALAAGNPYLTQVEMGAVGHLFTGLFPRTATHVDAFADWVEAQLIA